MDGNKSALTSPEDEDDTGRNNNNQSQCGHNANFLGCIIPCLALRMIGMTMTTNLNNTNRLLSAYTFCLHGRLCHFTSTKTLGEIWKNRHETETSTAISVASSLFFRLIIRDMMSSVA